MQHQQPHAREGKRKHTESYVPKPAFQTNLR
jgi:hypothetical protein